MDATAKRLREAEAEIDRLTDQLEQLSSVFEARCQVPPEWKLSQSESRVFGALQDGRAKTREQIMAALYWDRGGEEPDIAIVDQLMLRVRRKLAPFGRRIETRWGFGYQLATPEQRPS